MSPNKYLYFRDLCGTGHESGTSVRTELSQRPQSVQARANNLHRIRYKAATAEGADLSQRPLQTSNKSGTSEKTQRSQRPLRDQTQARNLRRSRPKTGISVGTGLNQLSQPKQA